MKFYSAIIVIVLQCKIVVHPPRLYQDQDLCSRLRPKLLSPEKSEVQHLSLELRHCEEAHQGNLSCSLLSSPLLNEFALFSVSNAQELEDASRVQLTLVFEIGRAHV